MDFYSSDSNDSDPRGTSNTLDLSYKWMYDIRESIEMHNRDRHSKVHRLYAYHNRISVIPENICILHNLRHIDLGHNRLTTVPDFLTKIPLVSLCVKNNEIDNSGLPKSFAGWSRTMERINIAGNNLTQFPEQIYELHILEHCYLGSNNIKEIPRNIDRAAKLTILNLGGNLLTNVPESVGNLHNLEILILSNNHLESIPPCIGNLKNLKTLQLHKNHLKALPTEIITLKVLCELSLRDNPLVVRFVNDMTYNPATLLEVAARVVKVRQIPYGSNDLPLVLQEYLDTAHHCLNPECKGVYFDSRVEHIKFVDFCGKYKLPLLQYLCSTKCLADNSGLGCSTNNTMMRKVLLG